MIDPRSHVAGCVGDLPEHLPRRVQQTFGAELLGETGALIGTCLATIGRRASILIRN